jgi:hypothetical protein
MKPPGIPEFLPRAEYKAGKFDKAGRWYPHEEYKVIGTFISCWGPSRSWPKSYLNHFHTKKYRLLLARHRPDLYFKLSGVDPLSEGGKLITAWAVYQRMTEPE